MTALSSARKTVAKEIVDQADPYLKAHVDEALILKSNQESLLAFTHTLIDNIIPQTVLVLRENFPAFANAPDEAFSKDLGFEIWTGQDAMGGAANSYEQTNDFQIRMRVYPESFMPAMDQKGAYIFDLKNDSRDLNEFKATMIHEMMHVFMYDYNRNGMDFFRKIPKTDDQLYPVPGFGDVTKNQLSDLRKTLLYPDWFAEGIATLFGAGFWSYDGMYSDLADPDDDSSYSAAGLYIMKVHHCLCCTCTYNSRKCPAFKCYHILGCACCNYNSIRLVMCDFIACPYCNLLITEYSDNRCIKHYFNAGFSRLCKKFLSYPETSYLGMMFL